MITGLGIVCRLLYSGVIKQQHQCECHHTASRVAISTQSSCMLYVAQQLGGCFMWCRRCCKRHSFFEFFLFPSAAAASEGVLLPAMTPLTNVKYECSQFSSFGSAADHIGERESCARVYSPVLACVRACAPFPFATQ